SKKKPGNRKIIQEYIQDLFGIFYDLSSIGKLLKRIGIKRLRPKVIPGKSPSIGVQVDFMLKYFQVRDMSQKNTGILQLFGDGMHLHHQAVPSFCWGDPKDSPLLNTNSNRKRLNILGAYSIRPHTLIHHTSEENCNAMKVIHFLKKIVKAFSQYHSIVLYLDNAPYFHADIVQKFLRKHPEIIIEPLPTYSPNLNLIERLWRFVKGKLTANRYFQKYKTFRAQTFRLLNHIQDFKMELGALITENFQLISI
ncbi:MAG: transposase, partial [bacterium]